MTAGKVSTDPLRTVVPCKAAPELDRADRDPSLVPEARVEHLKEKIATVREQMKKLEAIGRQLAVAPDQQVSLTDPDARSMAAYLPEVPAKNTDYHQISDGDWRRTRLGGVHRCIGSRHFDDRVTGAK